MWVVRVRWLTEEYSQTRRRILLSRRGYGAKRGAGSDVLAIARHTRQLTTDIGLMLALGGDWTARPQPGAKPGLALWDGIIAADGEEHERPTGQAGQLRGLRFLAQAQGARRLVRSPRPGNVDPRRGTRPLAADAPLAVVRRRLAAEALSIGFRCADCVYWRRPSTASIRSTAAICRWRGGRMPDSAPAMRLIRFRSPDRERSGAQPRVRTFAPRALPRNPDEQSSATLRL